MQSMACRLSRHSLAKFRAVTANSSRTFHGSSGQSSWKNETPEGSKTEVFVYSPELQIQWGGVDDQLGLVLRKDKNFSLPGDIGPCPGLSLDHLQEKNNYKQKPDILTSPTVKESQCHALYNANDFIKYTDGSEQLVLAQPTIVEDFPPPPSHENMDVEVHTCPSLLKKQLGALFPEQDLNAGALSIITMSIWTDNDMSVWSEQMEEEREKLTEHTVINCKEICGKLKDDGYWADFIDPCSGTPYFSAHTNTTMFETDEKYRLLGFRIEDMGCCKVIEHKKFNRHVFVGCIVTNAAAGSDSVGGIVRDINPYDNFRDC